MSKQPNENPIRKFRAANELSLEKLADMIAEHGLTRPSIAKLSRIECGQPIPLDMLPVLQTITGLPPQQLRPDVARFFEGAQ